MKRYYKRVWAVLLLFILTLPASYVFAQSSWVPYFHFKDKAPSDVAHFQYEIKPWTDQEKNIVIQQLTIVQRYAPGFMMRAIVYGPIQVYRVADNNVRTAQIRIIALAHPRNRYMVFSDRYFQYYRKGEKTRWFVFWTTVHELVHIVDLGDKRALSKQWNDLLGWRIRGYNNAIFGNKLNIKQKRQLMKKYGLITSYAAKDVNEALAEYTAAVLMERVPTFKLRDTRKIPVAIKTYIDHAVLSSNYKPDAANILFLQAYRYMYQRNYQQGIKLLTKAIARDPNFIAAYYARGKAWMSLGKYQNAYSDFKKALELNPGVNFLTVRIYYSLGLANYYQKLYPQAVAHFKRALALDPKDGFAYFYLARVYRDTNKLGLAITNFNKAVHYLPKYITFRKYSYYYIATQKIRQRDYQGAVKVLSQTIREYPRYAAAYYVRGLSWYNLKRDNYAMHDFKNALKHSKPKDSLRQYIYYYMGKIFQERKEYQQAINSYAKVLQINSRSGIAYYQLGYLYYKHNNNYQKSIATYRQAIKFLPKKSYYRKRSFLQIGLLYFTAKDVDNAINAYTLAIQHYPSYALAYLYRGIVYDTQRDYAKAIKDYEYAFVLDPKLKEKYGSHLQKAKEKLQSISSG